MEKKTYSIVFTEKARKQLYKTDPKTFKVITSWIKENLENCTDPRIKGKGLTANHSGEWRYRVGDYRIIADIRDNTVTILVLADGHRRNIYD